MSPQIKYELEVNHGSVYGPEELAALAECLENNAPSCGKKVKEFEAAFAEMCGTKYGLAVTSATTALTLAGIACGVGPGTEVITTPISWIATSNAFAALGADVVFCDVDPRTLCLDPAHLEALITLKTRAIVPVHLYGQCADMDGIMAIAKKHGVPVIEDCAHNPGGSFGGVKAGNLGDIGVFSFHQQKNMCTLGEGGLLTTNNQQYYEDMLAYRSLCCRIVGPSDKYKSIDESVTPMGKKYWYLQFDDIGFNYRMTDAQAAVGLEQMKKLPGNNQKRREIAEKLTTKLAGVKGLVTPWVNPHGEHAWHLYMVQLAPEAKLQKDDFMHAMYFDKGIKAWSHYLPIHLTKPYVERGHKAGECPVAEKLFESYVTLPLHPRLTDEAIDYMAACVHELLD